MEKKCKNKHDMCLMPRSHSIQNLLMTWKRQKNRCPIARPICECQRSRVMVRFGICFAIFSDTCSQLRLTHGGYTQPTWDHNSFEYTCVVVLKSNAQQTWDTCKALVSHPKVSCASDNWFWCWTLDWLELAVRVSHDLCTTTDSNWLRDHFECDRSHNNCPQTQPS